MADFYTGLANTALKLIKEKGQVVTLSIVSKDFDPVTGSATNQATVAQTGNAVIFPYDRRNTLATDFDASLVKGALIEAICEAVNFTTEPDPSTILTDAAGIKHQVMGVSVLSPAGIPVIYTLICAKNSQPTP